MVIGNGKTVVSLYVVNLKYHTIVYTLKNSKDS